MRVILYPRVSSKKQAESGDSIEAQISRMKSFCREKGYEMVAIYTDAGKSASITEDKLNISIRRGNLWADYDLCKRPAFKRLLLEADTGKFDGIVFFKWDRFSRDIALSKIAQEYFKRNKIELIPTDDSNDPLMVDLKGTLSVDETRRMVERVRLVRLQRFEKGMIVAKAPAGYKQDKKTKIMKIDKRKGDKIRRVFEMLVEGKDIADIRSELGVGHGSIREYIRNPVYMGYVTFEGKTKKGIHPPIVDVETWEKANEMYTKISTSKYRNRKQHDDEKTFDRAVSDMGDSSSPASV